MKRHYRPNLATIYRHDTRDNSSYHEETYYYLNFLAGDVRKITAINDPHYDWVTNQWDGNPIQIPVKA